MKRGVFIAQTKANCSIYESGLMIKDALLDSKEYTLDYIETDPKLVKYFRESKHPYDFYIINWHPYTLAISQEDILKLSKRIAIVLEVAPDNYTPMTPDFFHGYAIIDPTKQRTGKMFPLPRPIFRFPTKSLLNEDKLILGSFGLYSHQFSHEKRFGEIVEEANKTGRECIVRINLPVPSYTNTGLSTIQQYGNWLKSLANKNVEVIVTHEYMTQEQLVGWLSEHTMNCFPYYRERAGLSAVTDQAISSGRGIMTTECNTFRHLHKYISYFPKESYLSLSESTLSGVKQMQEDWSVDNFRVKFNSMLSELNMI